MIERPIDFTAEEVRATIEGRLTSFQRPVEPQPPHDASDIFPWYEPTIPDEYKAQEGLYYWNPSGLHFLSAWPVGFPGDYVWVRESIYIDDYQYDKGPLPETKPVFDDEVIYYRTDGECCEQIPECACAEYDEPTPWRLPEEMPRWAARLILEITDVKVEQTDSGWQWSMTFKRIQVE
jgi:hypothetical protein